MNRYAVGNRVVIKLDKIKSEVKKINGETRSKSGSIVLLEKNSISEDEKRGNEGTGIGVVVSMGDMAYQGLGNGNRWCKVGDRVCFKRYAGIDITDYENRKEDDLTIYRCMDDEDIMAIIKD